MTTKKGSCHCGAVEYEIPFNGEFDKVRRCNCSMCARRGAVVGSVLLADFKILKGEDNLTLYQWGTMEAKHYFCKTCGIYTHHKRRSTPTEYAVNIACFEGVRIENYKDAPYLDGRDHHPRDKGE